MARFKHATTGVTVEVADELKLGPEWVADKPAPRAKAKPGPEGKSESSK